MDVFEAIATQRAMRRLKPDPVPDELIWKIIGAAARAPSGGNIQPWNFVVIRDPEIKRQIAEVYRQGYQYVYSAMGNAAKANETVERIYRSANHLAEHLAEVPVLIMVTLRVAGVDKLSPPGASIFPAVQNLMLAARALGLGTTLTTAHRYREEKVREILGIPDGIETMTLIPVGWPEGRFGVGPRRPIEKVTYWDRWGETRAED